MPSLEQRRLIDEVARRLDTEPDVEADLGDASIGEGNAAFGHF